MLGKKRDNKVFLVSEILSEVDAIYKDSVRTTLSDVQEIAQRLSFEDEVDEDDDLSVDSDENEHEPAEEMARDVQDQKHYGQQSTPAWKGILDLCIDYNVKEPSGLVIAQHIIEYSISSIPRVVEITDPLAKTREMDLPHAKNHEAKVTRLNYLVPQQMLLQQNTADTPGYASVLSLISASLTNARENVHKCFKERDKF